jgi:hypothetical protein
MDKVRFGRALGKGTRDAAKSLWEAADAAASPSPRPRPAAAQAPPRPQVSTRANTAKAARTAGKSMLAPVKKFSSVLWLEVTGTFFALIALFLAQGVWRLRTSARAPLNTPEAHKFYAYAVIFLLFAWFAVSSFLRARHRGRRG